MRRLLTLLLVGVIVALSAWHACCRTPRVDAPMAAYMARFDTDHDGVLSLAEWHAHGGRDRTFEAFDFNGDGLLDRHEFEVLFLNLGRPLRGPRAK